MLESWDLLLQLLPTFSVKMGVAILCGFLLGIEREKKDKPAGLRTILLITVGSTLYMIVSDIIPLIHINNSEGFIRADPARIAAQVVSGIGFLGAGTIIQSRGAIHGLTTAAIIWISAGIGLCIGAGFPLLGFGATLIVLLILYMMAPIQNWLNYTDSSETFQLMLPNDSFTLLQAKSVLQQNGVLKEDISILPQKGECTLVFTYRGYQHAIHQLVEGLHRIEGLRGLPLPDDK